LALNPKHAYGRPSNLRITDIRGCTIAANYDYPIIKVYTNQDIVGLGEVRDAGWLGQALMLKPLIVGKDPLDIEGIMESLRPYADHGRYGGGFSAIDMALFDIAGKAMGWPAWKLVGEKIHDAIPIYGDTDANYDKEVFARRAKIRVDTFKLKHLKMDLQSWLIRDIPGAVDDDRIPTDKGIAIWGEYVEAVREAIGPDVVLGADHFGPMTVQSGIKLGKYMADPKRNLAYIEDVIHYTARDTINLNRLITEGSPTPTLNGEDIFGFDGFRPFIEARAMDIVHPDMATSGGIRETKKICDYAYLFGIKSMFHQAASPIAAIASAHCACTVRDLISMENHAMDMPWWDDLVTGIEKPLIQDGFMKVPDTPGLGLELNDDVARKYLREPKYLYKAGFFEPTPEFDQPLGWKEAKEKKIIGGYNNVGAPWWHLDNEGKLRYHSKER
ncbi:MAG: mandelate racemase/muconate lactonizing enzyme family protein, partial [Verrucomicrobiae bacterium]|nr:mandelate racemase/muconate lactonizing enzyme family protein [Verrucomicrobiae bacterium]